MIKKKKQLSKDASLPTRASKKSTPKYEFGKIEKFSFDKLLGAERGKLLSAYAQACNCGQPHNCDPYNCGGTSDNRCS